LAKCLLTRVWLSFTAVYLANQCSSPTFAVLRKSAGLSEEFFGPNCINMANHSATKKDVRQATKRRERNKFYGKTTRNAIREFRASTAAEASGKLPDVISMIDKLAKRGIIHKNKAANLKSKLSRKVVTK
jgi:small subunit ribosomal protein S20